MSATSSRAGSSAKVIWIIVIIIAVLIGGKYLVDALFPYEYDNYINEAAEANDVDPVLLYSMINVGSHFDKDVDNEKMNGLMQISNAVLDDTFKSLGYSSSSDYTEAQKNISTGAKVMRYLLNQYDNDEITALIAFREGTNAVASWQKDGIYSIDGKTLTSCPNDSTNQYYKKIRLQKKVYGVLKKVHDIGSKKEEVPNAA